MFIYNHKAGSFESKLLGLFERFTVVGLINYNEDTERTEILSHNAMICGHLLVRFIYSKKYLISQKAIESDVLIPL